MILLLPGVVFAQDGSITGTITDGTTGESLPGATVLLVEEDLGDATDLEGNYEIAGVPAGTYTLRVSFVGYVTHEESVDVAAGENVERNIGMQPDVAGLEEVVVVGYGTRARRDLTGSIGRVSSEDLENRPVSTPEQLLQGRTAGVQVATSSGMAGSTVNIRVRGPASISAGNQPLYVVDGVPVSTGTTGGAIGQQTNALADLNPQDIESIEVLKDASATAIYGSRGANGVVLITTKQGRAQGYTEFSLNHYIGSVDATYQWPVLTGPQWAEVYREAFDNWSLITQGEVIPNVETLLGYPQLGTPDEVGDYGIVDEAFRTGLMHETSLSARGGDERTRYYLSGTYMDQEGYIVTNRFQRASGRLNLEHDPVDWARVGANVGLTRTVNTRAPSDNLVAGTLTSSALRPPIVPVRHDDGSWFWGNPWNIADNSVAVAHVNDYNTNHWRTLGTAFAEVLPMEDLVLRLSGSVDLLAVDDYRRYSEESGDGAPDGFGSQQNTETQNWVVTATANYSAELMPGHSADFTAGTEYQQHRRAGIIASGSGFVSDLFPNVASAANPSTTTSFVDRTWGIESYFARAFYNIDDRYMLEASARLDGSSRFGEDNRYGFFPAGALMWRLSEEGFMQGADFVDDLRLRVSYGLTGNDQIGFFPALGLYGSADYAGAPGLGPESLANPDLRWESTASLDIGLDATFFDGRIGFTADVYEKRTTDMLLPVQVPLSSGFSSVTQNVGEMVNRGLELSLDTENIRGAFSWTSRFNISFNENEVQTLVDGEPIAAGLQRVEEGHPIASWYLIPWAGVDPETGMPLWLDADGNTTSSPSSATDRRLEGQVDPTWFGGLANTFSYAGLSLDVFLTFAGGHHVYNDTYRFMMTAATWNLHEDYMDRWQEPGDQTDVPRATFADVDNSAQASTRFLDDGTHLRLREVTLSYHLPTSLTEAMRVGNARVFVQGTNLMTWDHMSVGDPEGSYSGNTGNLNRGELFFTPPQQRSITGGVSLTF